MKKANQLGWMLVLATQFVGCADGSSDSTEVADGALQATPELIATNPPVADAVGSEETSLNCGSVSVIGETRPEVYYPEAMTRLLGEDAELRAAYGGNSVSSCEEARRFSDAQEKRASLSGDAVGEKTDATKLAVEKTDKILNGLGSVLTPVVQWVYNSGASGLCSAVIIGPHEILTSAHCIDSTKSGAQWVSFRKQVTKGVTAPFMFSTAVPVTWTRNSGYTGGVNATWDIAVGKLDPSWSFPSGSMMRIWLDAATAGQDIYYWGFGALYNGGPAPFYQTQGAGTLKSVSTYTFTSVPSTSPARTTCSGDSGGAQARYFSWEMLFGLTSIGDCATSSTATRVRYHMPWIEATLGVSCTRYSYNGQIYARCW